MANIQPEHWLAEYTTELLNLLNILGALVDLEPAQNSLLEAICAGLTLDENGMRSAGAFEVPKARARRSADSGQPTLFSTEALCVALLPDGQVDHLRKCNHQIGVHARLDLFQLLGGESHTFDALVKTKSNIATYSQAVSEPHLIPLFR